MKKISSILLSIFLLLSTFIPSVISTSSPAYTLKFNPNTKFDYKLTPGSTIKDYFTLSNLDPDRWLKLKISVDNVPDRWVKLDSNIIKLEPLESKNIPITITTSINSETITHNGLIISGLYEYEEKDPNTNKGIKIGMGIANYFNIEVINGEINNQDYTRNLFKENTISKTINSVKQISIKELITSYYIIIEENINVVLLIIIIGLLLKLALIKKHVPVEGEIKKKIITKKALPTVKTKSINKKKTIKKKVLKKKKTT